MHNLDSQHVNNNNTSATDLLGLSTPPTSATAPSSNANVLVDVLGDLYNSSTNSVGATQNTYNPKKYEKFKQDNLYLFAFHVLLLNFCTDLYAKTMEFCLKMS